MRKYISLALFILVSAWLMAPKPVLALNERAGDLFKAPQFSAVYMVGNDGKRHVFPIESVYKNWYGETWSLHKTMPLTEVSTWTLGRNIVFRPGTLVKIPSVPRIYLVKEVSSDRDLAYIEWIPTEADFNARGFRMRDVKDLPEPFFPGHYVELSNNNPTVTAQSADYGLDFDLDGIPDVIDNCPINPNRDQADRDSDRVGDVCDQYDNRITGSPANPIINLYPNINIPAPQIIYLNQPADPVPSDDRDGDGIADASDNCPNTPNATQSDIDGDGIGDACDPIDNRDTDGDGVQNASDNCPATPNAAQTDTDGDHIGDVCDPIDGRPAPDLDRDGLTDAEEAELGTNSRLSDTDSDGLSDYQEVRTYHTDPKNADTDGDGYFDGAEVSGGTNPLVREEGDCVSSCDEEEEPAAPADADRDGLTDADEARLGTNPRLADTDGDGLTDLSEVRTYYTNPLRADTDYDGLYDGTEVGRGTNPKSSDSDLDGLSDYEELYTHRTNPLNRDTDGDGYYDGAEIAHGTNPLVRDPH